MRSSKSQASLAKIISIISTVPKPDSTIIAIAPATFDIDLNLKVGPEELDLDDEEGPTVDHSISPAESAPATSEIKSECRDDGDDDGGEKKKRINVSDEGYIDLLLEAARKLDGSSGEGKDGDDFVVTPAKKRSSPPSDFYEETPPSVRSKRGRNRAMPSRYRDSVLEPWGKPPPVTRLGRAARN